MNTTVVGPRWRLPDAVRPYLADAGVALLVLGVLYAPLVIPRPEQPGPYPLSVWLLLAGTAAPLVIRRRFPIACLTAIYVCLLAYNTLDRAVSEPISWGVLVAVYSIAWVGRRWQQVVVVTLITATSLASMKSPTTATIGLLVGGSALLLGTLARRRDARLRELAFRAGQLERDRETEAARAVLTERARIARDMHDILAHAVSLMVVQAEAGPVALRSSPKRAEKAFDAIASAGRDAMVQLRSTLGLLKQDQDTGIRTPQPSVAAIPALVDQVRSTGLTVLYSVSGTPARLMPETEVAAYRIVQEALTNTIKHARAQAVTVTLDWSDRLRITVRDDGRGPARPAGVGSGRGLIGIRERAASCGGTAELSFDSHGCTVTATLPMAERGERVA
jgi:signal transduction histidine kinase